MKRGVEMGETDIGENNQHDFKRIFGKRFQEKRKLEHDRGQRKGRGSENEQNIGEEKRGTRNFLLAS